MTSKEMEARSGVPRANIRYYEAEGLLAPARSGNGYRDYSEEDLRTLEKIKLLRRLSLDLDAIRRLQAGELSLSRALAGQALALEGDRADLERYAQVCEELSRSETSYDDLDPEPWLAALEEKSLPLSRRVDPAEQDSIAAAPYPGGGSSPGRWTGLWRRFSGPRSGFSCSAGTGRAGGPRPSTGMRTPPLSGWADGCSFCCWSPFCCAPGATPRQMPAAAEGAPGGRKQAHLVERSAAHPPACSFGGRVWESPCSVSCAWPLAGAPAGRDRVLPWDRGLEYTARRRGQCAPEPLCWLCSCCGPSARWTGLTIGVTASLSQRAPP